MNTSITVLVKDVYGKRVFYPKCDKALCFAAIAGTTTLTERVLRNIMELGYEISFVRNEVNLAPLTINTKETKNEKA
jgi:hypothetical protein